MTAFVGRPDMLETDDADIQRRIGALQALVSNNRDGIQEVKQSIKELQASLIETQKLVIAGSEYVRGAIGKLEHVEASLDRLKADIDLNETTIEKRVEALEKLQAKVTGGIVVLVCLLNAPWEWFVKLLRISD